MALVSGRCEPEQKNTGDECSAEIGGGTRFDESFRASLSRLIARRRDVRRFRPDALPDGLLDELLRLACLAPSVGFSQPWRWVIVDSEERRAAVLENFQRCNGTALSGYTGEQAVLYARLKLAGLREAPIHVALFVDPSAQTGSGLGRATMPETVNYSGVCALHTLWLAARAHGVGMGWVSILDAKALPGLLGVPETWQLIAYLCLGYPAEEQDTPELEREGWEKRLSSEEVILHR